MCQATRLQSYNTHGYAYAFIAFRLCVFVAGISRTLAISSCKKNNKSIVNKQLSSPSLPDPIPDRIKPQRLPLPPGVHYMGVQRVVIVIVIRDLKSTSLYSTGGRQIARSIILSSHNFPLISYYNRHRVAARERMRNCVYIYVIITSGRFLSRE